MDKKNVNTGSSQAANSGNKVNSGNSVQPTNVGAILAQSQKDKTGQSAYGATVDLICKDLTLLSDRTRLNTELTKLGIDLKSSKNAIQTGISQTRNVVAKLHQNGFLA